MKLKAVKVFSFIFLAILAFTPSFSSAQNLLTDGIVPCKGLDCTACDVFKLVSNLMTFVWQGAAIIAAFMFMLGGYFYFRNKPAEAKKVLTNTVIGIAIAFFAWIGIDTVIKVLATGRFESGAAKVPVALDGGKVKYGPWNKIECKATISRGLSEEDLLNQGQTIGLGETPRTPYDEGVYTDADARARLKAVGIEVNKNNCLLGQKSACTSLEGIKRETLQSVIDLKRDCRCTVVVTGGTEGGHSAGEFSHGSGYKIDVAANANPTQERLFAADPISSFVLTNYENYLGKRSDGAHMYSNSRKCLIFADERNIPGKGPHWDILVKPSPPATQTNPYPPCR